jgi:hypothetical protein
MSGAGAPALEPAAQRTLDAWHAMMARADFAGLPAVSAADVIFRSPVAYSPYPGRAALQAVIAAAARVFEDFRYHRTFVAGGRDAVLEFSARIGGIELKGIDMIRFNAAGEIAEFEVMIRPANAVLALGQRMKELVGPELKRLGIG